jgi:hypothetical protein
MEICQICGFWGIIGLSLPCIGPSYGCLCDAAAAATGVEDGELLHANAPYLAQVYAPAKAAASHMLPIYRIPVAGACA